MDQTGCEEMRTEASRIEEDALYSARSHFEAARTWGNAHLWIGVPAAVLAAIASASAFKDATMLAGSLAIIVAALSAISTFLNPSERAQSHHQAGGKYNALRNRVRIFRELGLQSEATRADLLVALKAMALERDDLNLSTPQIPRWAFSRARRGIEAGEAAYRVDSGKQVAVGGRSDRP
jgi:hypothetical protein